MSACLEEGWTAAAEQTRQVVDLQTGHAFREGDDLRRAIAQSAGRRPDKLLATLATFLADIGRYGDATAIIGHVRGRQPDNQLLMSAEAHLSALANREAEHAGASGSARDLGERLKIGHLSMQARAAVLLSVLYFREGNYDRSLAYLLDAQKSDPAESGIRDMIFLTAKPRWPARSGSSRERLPSALPEFCRAKAHLRR